MGFVEGPGAITPILWVTCLQYVNDFCKPGASGPEYPAIFNEILTDLIVLDLKEDSLAQAMVLYNDLASYLCIACYLIGTDFAQSLMSW